MNASELSKELSRMADAVVKHLLPNGKRNGKEWQVGSLAGEQGKSLSVALSGTKAGVWSDFATGQSGDLLDLWMEVRSLDLHEVMKEAKQFAGIRDIEPRFSQPERTYSAPKIPARTGKPKSEVLKYLTEVRKLTLETIELFKIAESGNHILFPYLKNGERVMVKQDSCIRNANGKRTEPPRPTSADQKPILFGWQAIPKNSRYVILTEGEIDAMSWRQAGQPALSVPFGGGSGAKHQWLEHEFEDLEIFDEILLAFDNDPTGQEATRDLVQRLGAHRCRVIEGLPTKDANEALQKGILDSARADTLVKMAKPLDPEELGSAYHHTQDVIDMFYPVGEEPGYFSPWIKADKLFKFRPAELSILNGVNGHGKSELAGHIILGAMEQGEKICIASMELQPKRLLHRLMRQACAVTGSMPSKDMIWKGMEWTREKLWLFELTGTAKASRILEVFEYAHRRYGIKTFVVDSLMKCGIAEDDYNGQKAFIEALCDFKNKYSIHIFLITHSRKGDSETKPTGKMDIKGTGAISDLADNVFVIWRNKIKEEKIKEQDADVEVLKDLPDAILYCCKQRNGDWEGKLSLWFCPYTKQYLGSRHDKPKCYVGSEVSYG